MEILTCTYMHKHTQTLHMFNKDTFITKIFMLYVNFSSISKHSLTAQ